MNTRLAAQVRVGSRFLSQRRILPYLAALLTTMATLSIYALTAARDITWAYSSSDGGELIAAAVTLGVPHPPGYPLYVLCGKLFSLLPLDPVAFRFNLLSALCVAMSAGILAGLTASLLAGNGLHSVQVEEGSARAGSALWSALFSGTTFAFLPLVWQQALIAEVYGLNLLTVSVLLWVIFRVPTRTSGWLPGLALGIAVTTHLTSLLLFLPAIVAVRRGLWLRFIVGFVAGLAPFLLLPLYAANDSPVIWGSPRSVSGWWWIVSAKIYRPNLFALPVSRWAERLSTWGSEPTLWIACVLLVVILLRCRILARITGPAVWILLASPALYIAHALAYDAPDALVFVLPALSILCLGAALTLRTLPPWYLLLPLALLVLNFHWIDLSEHIETRSLAESALREAPLDAIILTSGDRATFTLWYLQYVEGQRKDTVLVDENLFAFDWYRTRLGKLYPHLGALDRDDLVRFRQHNVRTRPWCNLRLGSDRVLQYSCTKGLV